MGYSFTKILKSASRIVVKNSPTILTGLSVGGLLTTVILAISATPKAMRRISKEEQTRKDEGVDEPLSAMQIAGITWRCYIPTVVMGATTVTCIIGANAVHLRRNAALVSLYSLTDTALNEYRNKVVDLMGEKKAAKVDEEIVEDRLKNNPVNDKTVIITGKGDVLCYDKLSGRYFKSDIETLRRVQNDFNHQLLSDMFRTLNELYSDMGLPPIELGRLIGWSAQKGLLEFKFSSKITPEGIPCLVIEHRFEPSYDD